MLATLAACGPAVPDPPSYEDDVKPILVANCVRCHGAPEPGVVDQRFCVRVDQWSAVDDTTGACPVDQADPANLPADIIYGAELGGATIVDQSMSKLMPKDGPTLTARQLDILAAWRDAGFPRRGPGSNSPPTIQFVTPPAAGATVAVTDLTYEVQYVVADADGDAVTWSLTWDGAGRNGTFATGLREGTDAVTVDISVLGEGTYTLTAHLDDTIEQVDVTAPGTLSVPPGRNATPDVTVIAPNGGQSFYMNGSVDVVFVADDAEDASVTCTVDAVSGTTGTISIAAAQVATSGAQTTVPWSLASAPIASDYRIRVQCQDAGTPQMSGSDDSDSAFAVTAPPQQVSFSSQILPLLTSGPTSCVGMSCHDPNLPQASLNLTAGSAYPQLVGIASTQCGAYQRVNPGAPDQSYLVFKLQGSGPCFMGSKMPKPPQTALTAAQIQLVRDWIANGAPNN